MILLMAVFLNLISSRKSLLTSQLCVAISVVVFAFIIALEPGWSMEDRIRHGQDLPFYLSFHLGWVLLLFSIGIYCLQKFKALNAEILVGKSLKLVLIFGFLVVVPMRAAVGTANPIFNVTGFYSVPWFSAIIFLLILIKSTICIRGFWFELICIFSIALFSKAKPSEE